MMKATASAWTVTERHQILSDALEIDHQLIAIHDHLVQAGTVIPMRTLGHWEEMRLDQRDIITEEMAVARTLATQWPDWD